MKSEVAVPASYAGAMRVLGIARLAGIDISGAVLGSVLLAFGCGDGSLGSRDASVDASTLRDGGADASAPDAMPFDANDSSPDSGTDAAVGCPRLGPWRASEPWGPGASHPMPSFALGSRYYVHTEADRSLRVADVGDDGSLGPWRDAGDHGGGPHGFTALSLGGQAFHFRNGHIARFRFLADGSLDGDVELLEESVDAAFGGNRYVWDVAIPIGSLAEPRGVLHLGGFSFAGYAYRPHVMRSGFPVASSFVRVGDFPVERPGNAAYVATSGSEGWIFARESGGSRFFRARMTGLELSSFEELTPLPDGDDNGRGDVFALDCSLFVVRGRQVYVSDVRADGSLGGFESQPPLPEPQIDVSWGDGHQEGAAFGVVGRHVLLTGPRRVFSARIVD